MQGDHHILKLFDFKLKYLATYIQHEMLLQSDFVIIIKCKLHIINSDYYKTNQM